MVNSLTFLIFIRSNSHKRQFSLDLIFIDIISSKYLIVLLLDIILAKVRIKPVVANLHFYHLASHSQFNKSINAVIFLSISISILTGKSFCLQIFRSHGEPSSMSNVSPRICIFALMFISNTLAFEN